MARPAAGRARLRASAPSGTAMASRETAFVEITPEVLLKAYACGIFPMAESADDPALYWIEPEKRGIIPLDTFHVPSRLARTVRSDRFSIAVNRDFEGVLDGCAEPQPGRARTWINARIRTLYQQALRHRPLPQRRGLRRRRAGRRALWRVPRPRVLRREHVPPRARRLEGGAGASGGAAPRRRLHAARHPVRHRSSEDVRRARSAAPRSITSCSKQR